MRLYVLHPQVFERPPRQPHLHLIVILAETDLNQQNNKKNDVCMCGKEYFRSNGWLGRIGAGRRGAISHVFRVCGEGVM